jgi:hypothetical protein
MVSSAAAARESIPAQWCGRNSDTFRSSVGWDCPCGDIAAKVAAGAGKGKNLIAKEKNCSPLLAWLGPASKRIILLHSYTNNKDIINFTQWLCANFTHPVFVVNNPFRPQHGFFPANLYH